MKAAEAATVELFFLHAVSMKKGRIVNYHGRGRKKTAKIARQIRAVAADLHVLYSKAIFEREAVRSGGQSQPAGRNFPRRCACRRD
jgi:hypothetical protein